MAKKKALAWSPVRDLMKSVGGQVVARDAVDLLISALEDKAKACTSSALKLARHSKRTKVMREDVSLALKEDCKL